MKAFTIFIFSLLPVLAFALELNTDRRDAARERFDADGGREFLLSSAENERGRLLSIDGETETPELVEDTVYERNYITSESGGFELSPDAELARENLTPERYMRERGVDEFRFEGVKLLPEFRFEGFALIEVPTFTAFRFTETLFDTFTVDPIFEEIEEEARLALLYPLAKKSLGEIHPFSPLAEIREDYEAGLLTREEYLKEYNAHLEEAQRQ